MKVENSDKNSKAHLYEFTDYRLYLEQVLAQRGRKKQLAEFIPCQTTFLSNVLANTSNLSLEHAIRICDFLLLSEKEAHYFMLLVYHGRAGSKELEAYYQKQIVAFQLEQQKISSRVAKHETVKTEDQIIFYNAWIYAAIHIMAAVKEFQSRKDLRNHLHLPKSEIDPVIDFLIQQEILIEEQGRLRQGTQRIHLAKGSPFLPKHHLNWRMKAVQSLDHEKEDDLHYTMVMSLSESDVKKMKTIILESVQKTDALLKVTGDEVVYSFCMDWFKI